MYKVYSKNRNDEWYTPESVVTHFGKFDYDPATTKEQAIRLGIINFDTKETDGLSKDWNYKRIWLNPPFSRKWDFLKKAKETYEKYGNEIYILLPIQVFVSKKWYSLGLTGKIYIPSKRISFYRPSENNCKQPPFGTVIFKISNINEWETYDG